MCEACGLGHCEFCIKQNCSCYDTPTDEVSKEIHRKVRELEQLHVDITEDSIRIYDGLGTEIVGWTETEWKDDPTIVIAIANAINLAHVDPGRLRRLVRKK